MRALLIKNRTCHLILTLLLFLSCDCFSQWRQKYAGSNMDNDIKGIYFLNPSTGFVAFTTYIGYTQDSGQSYLQRNITVSNTNYNGYSVNLTFGFNASKVFAFTQDSLFVTGDYGFEPTILFSANQGQNWKVVFHLPYNPNSPVVNQGVTDIKFPGNASTGIAIHHEGILKSTDRGQT